MYETLQNTFIIMFSITVTAAILGAINAAVLLVKYHKHIRQKKADVRAQSKQAIYAPSLAAEIAKVMARIDSN